MFGDLEDLDGLLLIRLVGYLLLLENWFGWWWTADGGGESERES